MPALAINNDVISMTNKRFCVGLTTDPGNEKRLTHFKLSSKGNGKYDIDTGFNFWTGFAALTGHLGDYFITTDSPQSPQVWLQADNHSSPLTRGRKRGSDDHKETTTPEPLLSKEGNVAFRYGPMQVAAMTVDWFFRLDDENLWITPRIHLNGRLRTDNEVALLLFDCPNEGDIVDAFLDSGFVVPPRDWFKSPPPKITYEGSWKASNRDKLRRWRFAGLHHQWLQLHFKQNFGLRLESADTASFKVCMTPLTENGDGFSTYQYRSTEHFGLGTPFENERRTFVKEERYGATVKISYVDPCDLESLAIETPDRKIARATRRFHLTHGHSTQPHDAGFCNGCHAVGNGFPGVDSFGSVREYSDSALKDGVTFEYFMHGHTHLYSVWPGLDAHWRRTLDAIDAITWPDGMIYGGHRLGKRGLFYETNASCLCFFADYVRRTGDASFLQKAWRWRDFIAAHIDRETGLFKTPSSTGISGRGKGSSISHWWDTIAFGGCDGYINALTYRALKEMAEIERAYGVKACAEENESMAAALKDGFNNHLWNVSTGRYAGWKDTDGNLHDAWYTFINLMAIVYGIADDERSLPLLESMDAKMKETGYRGFSIPGNLESIPPDDYSGGDWWYEEYGYRHNFDPLGIYLNGGIWPWVSGYHIAAWAKFDPSRALKLYKKILGQYEKDNLYGAGNGYFWDLKTGLDAIGSREEAYLANTSTAIWGFLRLFGIDYDIPGGITLRPTLPKELSGSNIGVMYHGKRIHLTFEGHGSTVKSITVHGKAIKGVTIPDKVLKDGVEVSVECE